ncbi:MAG TPA: hypothetical protein VGM44_05730, partial [Polyangiaceae bacterium]
MFVLAMLAGAALIVLLAKTLLLIFAGVLFAIVLRAAAAFVSRLTRLPYKLALAACVLTLVGLGVGMMILCGTMLASQVRDFGKTLPATIASVQT